MKRNFAAEVMLVFKTVSFYAPWFHVQVLEFEHLARRSPVADVIPVTLSWLKITSRLPPQPGMSCALLGASCRTSALRNEGMLHTRSLLLKAEKRRNMQNSGSVIRVLVVDDHESFRAFVCATLE